MLSKKEYTPIKLREHCIKTMQFSNRNSNAYKEHELILAILDENISMRYKLDHLESREQKLIEKLEEESKQLEHDILTMSIDTGNKYSLKLIHQAEGMKKQNDRILGMLKN